MNIAFIIIRLVYEKVEFIIFCFKALMKALLYLTIKALT